MTRILILVAISLFLCSTASAFQGGGGEATKNPKPTPKPRPKSAAKPKVAPHKRSSTPTPGGVVTTPSNKGGRAMTVSPVPIETSNVGQSLAAFRGKVVILNLWATWAGPCRIQIPDFIKLREKYGTQGFEVIGVSIDPIAQQGGGAAAVAPFMKQYGINYPIWMITDQAALGQYPLGQGIPTTYIIDRNGHVAQKYIGARPMSVFENDIKQLL